MYQNRYETLKLKYKKKKKNNGIHTGKYNTKNNGIHTGR